ncbi:MAG TPA: hypothetical protein VFJ82_03195 [Longimicrobium sp.]|nr:hypothetical protein [Longimicrobium sp.]
MALNPDDLNVDSFPTTSLSSIGGGDCCTGCVSGCGYNPTASGCESASGQVICPVDQTAY